MFYPHHVKIKLALTKNLKKILTTSNNKCHFIAKNLLKCSSGYYIGLIWEYCTALETFIKKETNRIVTDYHSPALRTTGQQKPFFTVFTTIKYKFNECFAKFRLWYINYDGGNNRTSFMNSTCIFHEIHKEIW
jgi:hypothetical protein